MTAVRRRFIGGLDQTAAAREWLSELLREAGVAQRDVNAFELAVSEASSNILRHAYEGRYPAAFEVHAEIEISSVTVRLRDEGRPYAPDGVTAPDPDALQEGGYGVFLIQALMDEVIYTPGETGTELRMTKVRTRHECVEGAE